MKKIFVVLLTLLFITSASAIQLNTQIIEVNLDQQGNANIIERYELIFFSNLELEQFREKVQENASSLGAWNVDYPFFFPRFAEEAGNTLDVSFVTFEEDNRTLTLEYHLDNEFATLVRDEPRATLWEIPDKQFSSYQTQGLIIIPQNTVIRITPPSNSRILLDTLSSQARVEGNTVVLSGISTNNVNTQYVIQKPLSPSVNSFQFIREFLLTPAGLPYVFITIVALTLIYWKRKIVSEKIEKYVEDHSEIEHQKPEEEIEVELER